MLHNIDHKKPGKHCHNCLQLEWGQGDWNDPRGWICNKREYETIKEEDTHLHQLNSESYRFKGKRCFEPKSHKCTGSES